MSKHLEARPIRLAEANAFIIEHHRHHDAAWGHKFSLGAFYDGKLVGVATVGRPNGRYLDDGQTLEVTRLATDGTRNACSLLYGAAAREAKARGYHKIITFTLMSENGASLRASGWTLEAENVGKKNGWNSQRWKGRPEQMTLFPKKIPPCEYKKRWSKMLVEGA